METIQGKIINIKTYRESGWGRFLISTAKGEEKLCVGTIYDASVGESIKLIGKEEDNGYGPQFTITKYEKEQISSYSAINSFLSGGFIKGIGPKTASKVINTFGDKTKDIFEYEIFRLTEIKGITDKKLPAIQKSYNENKHMIQLIDLFNGNITKNQADKIYSQYQTNAIDIIKSDPYRLYRQIDGFGFLIVDSLAQKIGFEKTSEKRISAAISHTLENAENLNGHLYLTKDELKNQCLDLLSKNNTSKDDMAQISCLFDAVLEDERFKDYLVFDDEKIYRSKTYHDEVKIAQIIASLAAEDFVCEFDDDWINDVIQIYENNKSIELNSKFEITDEQKEAVRTALASRIHLIIGGPGHGKTTILKLISDCFSMKYGMSSVILLAPTGRAAQRMTEATGYVAKTIQRELFMAKKEGRTPQNALIIVDEASMIDNVLMRQLMEYAKDSRIIFVGDANQLPSVGPGKVLFDLINSPISKIILTKGHRNSGYIAYNTNMINSGNGTKFWKYDDSFKFISSCSEQIQDKVVDLYLSKLKHYPLKDIMLMTPQKTGILSVDVLNQRLQHSINGNNESIKFNSSTYFIGDRVMHIKNDYSLETHDKDGSIIYGVFNGERGIVESVNPREKSIIVELDDGRKVMYTSSNISELSLAFATTIHKCQGSEATCCIIAACLGNWFLMSKNMLNTAVSRAKKENTLIGEVKWDKYEKNIFNMAVKKTDEAKRNTNLSQRISFCLLSK